MKTFRNYAYSALKIYIKLIYIYIFRVGPATWVRLGDLDISIDNDDAEPVELRIKRRINHPQYNGQRLYHDIALYELEREVKLNSYIRPLCLYTGRNLETNAALASGWGHTSWGKFLY